MSVSDDVRGSERSLTVGAAGLRAALDLTAYQLKELTAGLAADVGSRANYPRYRRETVHQMTVVQMLREARVPLDAAMKAARDHVQEITQGLGWLLCSPEREGWDTTFVRTGPDLMLCLRAVGGRGCVLDLDMAAAQCSRHWNAASAAA